ncbi:VOC family protein [Streptomyces genisteinicus]|uniref:VOC family protein n=1 Tax=Streptomyces genisteinicus TaxID=2768068 RepID=A0A7H0HTF2_9ACTN|nr:VOC family protein [Streptomyces genisteinicus]
MAEFVQGTPCWVDAALPDVEAGKRFYSELFGWTFTDRGGERLPGGRTRGRSADAYSGGRLVAALTPKSDGRMPTVWSVYLATPDAPALARRIAEGGGQVINAPLPVGPEGAYAVAADPTGAVFGLWQAGERAGFEKHGEPGSYCWTEVYTRDKERADAFYEGVFGYQGTDLPGITSEDFRMWSPEGAEPGESTAVGGRSVIDDSLPAEMPGHFLVYFCVEDCDETARKAAELGGRVRTAPYDIPYGRIAELTDDQGAAFAVLAEPAGDTAPGAARGAEDGGPDRGGEGRGGDGPEGEDRGGEDRDEGDGKPWPHDSPGPVRAPDEAGRAGAPDEAERGGS